jgi:carbamoyltransferase
VRSTSFNEHEPIGCPPQDALNTFLKTRMDVLVLGDTYLARG